LRKELAKMTACAKKFSSVFTRIGRKTNYKGHSEETILLNSIIDLETNKKLPITSGLHSPKALKMPA